VLCVGATVGSWARERYVTETRLTQGMQMFGSTRGVSSHQHNPFAAVTIGPPHETQGEVCPTHTHTVV
jgi:alpha-galactosidase